ncbi:outer membrane protein assembly factor BamD [Campylobacter sp. MIT 97-5078]|uniref:outer membrane protein assembly factor BamD n=1 Tax=Campylobacter sp. MIT 97-5078 TaxID=1548153 RepID=UPI000512CB0A|nr:outer membrane protein assembly factor BamD [Campylobacter sp. MIT 97-5078]KGI56484.1 outer membrane assembly lipoprotein YfiO [Campylobacter sp. MIT 97-5078]TQR27996.1 outer membrane protein assembly factor BamD [Campylobacter sp. MIT 97-5078]
MKTRLLFFLSVSFLFLACSTRNDELYNLSALQWHEQIIKDIQDNDLEKADEHYTSMASEHSADALLEPIQLILAQMHIEEEEYKLADFYLEENAKKFGNSQNLDFIRYLQIKAKFEAFAQPNREQALLLAGRDQIATFSKTYPQTEYAPLVQTMLTKFNLAIFALDENIASLYKRTDREQSYEVYQQRLQESEFNDVPMIKAKVAWYRRIFE